MTEDSILSTIYKSWAWAGLAPQSIIASNAFGNVIVRAIDGSFWRICPEELTCDVIASDDDHFHAIWNTQDFQHDWQMQTLVDLAVVEIGPVAEDRCYCLKIPAVIGGSYNKTNLGTITRLEVISLAGRLAQQIKDVPDGGQIVVKVTK